MEIDINKPAFDIKIRCNNEILMQMQKHYGENLENLSTDNLMNFLDKTTKTGRKTNIGNVKVDKEFMQKEIKKHLDDPAKRGMVTTEEMLSFPKVAKNVEAEFNGEINNYTWKAKANDENILAYGSREYNEENRLLTIHSKTERGQRQTDKVGSVTNFNDPNFRGSAPNDEIIPQQIKQSNSITQAEMEAIKKEVNQIGNKVLNSNENKKNIDRKLDL